MSACRITSYNVCYTKLLRYRREGERWSFFEIDPLVVRIARDRRFFHFVSDCAPKARMVVGDGRLTLAREPDRAFDMLILDAFSSDAIPVHLLTREAFKIYLAKLRRGGVLASYNFV